MILQDNWGLQLGSDWNLKAEVATQARIEQPAQKDTYTQSNIQKRIVQPEQHDQDNKIMIQ